MTERAPDRERWVTVDDTGASTSATLAPAKEAGRLIVTAGKTPFSVGSGATGELSESSPSEV